MSTDVLGAYNLPKDVVSQQQNPDIKGQQGFLVSSKAQFWAKSTDGGNV